jgi:hypothetical protein
MVLTTPVSALNTYPVLSSCCLKAQIRILRSFLAAKTGRNLSNSFLGFKRRLLGSI